MVQYITTPWRFRSELLHVRSCLYPSGSGVRDEETREAKRLAVARVGVWVQRGNCPHLVESTAILTSTVLNDVGSNERYCVRAAYASAFCRFVTGLLDSHQDKRKKLSMYSIAKTIGLPATYVELRHQATHEELPSLSKLRMATQKALRWIWDYYWVHLKEDAEEVRDCKVFLRKLIQEKDDVRRWELERELGGWDGDQFLGTLIEIQSEADEPETLLKILQLHRSIVDGIVKETKAQSPRGKQVMDMDAVRAEMASMENDLNMQEYLDEQPEHKEMQVKVDSSGKGWTMWEGPWVPKPIGVV